MTRVKNPNYVCNAKKYDFSTDGMTNEEKKEIALTSTTLTNKSRGNTCNQVAKTGYLDNPDAQELHTIVRNEGFKKIGRPTCWKSVEQLKTELAEYFDLCREHNLAPVMVGMANYLGVSNDTIQRHRKDPNSPFYSTLNFATQLIQELAQGALVNNKMNPMAYMFMAGNYWGEKDVRQINIAPIEPNGTTPTEKEGSIEAIKEQIAREDEQIMEATFREK